jgi:hypothetical protein
MRFALMSLRLIQINQSASKQRDTLARGMLQLNKKVNHMVAPFAAAFEAQIAFERYVIERAVPLVEAGQTRRDTLYLDGRPTIVEIGITTTLGLSLPQAVDELNLRPLMFGAAWKILDVLFEQAMAYAKPPKKPVSIADRVNAVRNGSVKAGPLASDIDLWTRICAVYTLGVEYRHSLIHRLVTVASNGAFVGTDAKGNALPSFGREEQIAFCRATQRAATSVISGTLTPRNRNALGAELDKLSTLTGIAPGGFTEAEQPIPEVTIPVTSTTTVDMSQVRAIVAAKMPKNREVNVYFDVTDIPGLRFFCHLEEAPDVRIALGPTINFSWLTRC